MSAKSASTGQIDLIANLTQLREKFGNMDQATREQILTNLGLSDSLDEINEEAVVYLMNNSNYIVTI